MQLKNSVAEYIGFTEDNTNDQSIKPIITLKGRMLIRIVSVFVSIKLMFIGTVLMS